MDTKNGNQPQKTESPEKFRFWAHVDSIKDEVALLKELSSGYRPVFQNNTKL